MESIIRQKSFDFALNIIDLYRKLQEKREYVISRQLLRSGTSIGTNVEEATAGQSRKDFLSKMARASKEAREQNIGCSYSIGRSLPMSMSRPIWLRLRN
jgi:four helix bundle protein